MRNPAGSRRRMRQTARRAETVALTLMLAAFASACATTGRTLSAPSLEVTGSRSPSAPLTGTLYLPAGQGPFPVVILLHGCSGIGPSQPIWAARVNGWGYAAVILDSFGPHGIADVCPSARQPLVTPRNRAADVLSMAMYLLCGITAAVNPTLE